MHADQVRGLVLEEDDIDLSAYLAMTEGNKRVKQAIDWRQELMDEVAGRVEWKRQTYLPWEKVKDKFAFRPGEVSLWFGINGHGKSLKVGQVVLSQIAQGEKAIVFSFEMKPRRTLARMLRQWAGKRLHFIEPSEVDEFLEWSRENLYVWDQTGTTTAKIVCAAIRWAVEHKGITVAVVDNLIKCVKSDEDYDGQKWFVDELTAIARDLNIHIHLVHHPRKGEDERHPPRKMDALGAGAITNLVDNVLIAWKNKPKLEAHEAGKHDKDHEPDQLLIVDKQRNGEWEGKLALWFHAGAQAYVERTSAGALDYRTWPHGERYPAHASVFR